MECLVANAPHVPIHLGAMSFAVKAQKELWEGKLEQGDVLVSIIQWQVVLICQILPSLLLY